MTATMTIDQDRLEQFLGRFVEDAAAAESAVCAYLGDRLGLYEAMAEAGPVTSAQLAERTDTHERYVREWLSNQAAGGYVTYDAGTDTFELPPEQAAVLADPDSPVHLTGIFEIVAAMWAATGQLEDAFRTGEGLGWEAHDPRLYRGVARLFGPIYRSQLIEDWIPALEGVEQRLRDGAQVADVGCGHGISTLEMAKAYPASRFVGFDYHEASVAQAAKQAADAGLGDRVSFEVAAAEAIPGEGYDLICLFDCFHDMGDPIGVATHLRASLAEDGALLLVEPMAGDDLMDNLNPVSRLYYAGSVALCTPSSLAQEGRMGLGAQAGQARLTEVLNQAGFTCVRRATETPFNLILEARP